MQIKSDRFENKNHETSIFGYTQSNTEYMIMRYKSVCRCESSFTEFMVAWRYLSPNKKNMQIR